MLATEDVDSSKEWLMLGKVARKMHFGPSVRALQLSCRKTELVYDEA